MALADIRSLLDDIATSRSSFKARAASLRWRLDDVNKALKELSEQNGSLLWDANCYQQSCSNAVRDKQDALNKRDKAVAELEAVYATIGREHVQAITAQGDSATG